MSTRTLLALVLAAVLSGLSGGSALAQDEGEGAAADEMAAAETAATGELTEERVSVLAGSCANCHGTDGLSPGIIPSIAGAPEDVLAEQLLGFKSGEIEGTVMNRIARGYEDEELQALASYFSQIEE